MTGKGAKGSPTRDPPDLGEHRGSNVCFVLCVLVIMLDCVVMVMIVMHVVVVVMMVM